MKPDTATSGSPTSVLAKLRAQKEEQAGKTETLTLPNSGVVVSYPTFRGYDDWSRAQATAGQDAGLINLYYIVAVCQFDGERLKANDYRELVPADDHLAISAKLFGGGPAKDGLKVEGSGNA